MPEESGTPGTGGQAPEAGTAPAAGETTPPENTPPAAPEATPDPVAEAKATLEKAQEAAAKATGQEAEVARERAKLAEDRLAFAEQQAKAGSDQFPKEVVDKLRNEAAGHRTKLREKEAELEAATNASRSEVERLEREVAAERERADTSSGKLTRLLVARKAGLPDDLAERLVGDDEEALKKDAEKLVKLVGAPEAPKPRLDQGPRGGTQPAAGEGEDARGAMNNFIRSHGGRREVPGQTAGTPA